MNIRSITRFMYVLTTVALISGFSACDNALNEFVSVLDDDEMPQLTGVSGEILIGVVHPVTGRLSSQNPPMEYGFRLAVDEINNAQLGNARLKLVIADGQSTAEGAVEAFKHLIDQDVPVILGPASSSQAKAAFPIAQENQVVVISPTSAASGLSGIGDFVFRTSLVTDVLIPNGVSITQEKLGYQRVATISDEIDVFSKDSDAVLKKALTENGVEIVASEVFRTGETDFSAQLNRIKESNPDAVFISAPVVESPEIVIQGRALGIPTDVPFLIIVAFAQDGIETAGDAAEGVITFANWISTASTPGNQAFVRNYQAAYGVAPNTWAAQSYAAVYVLAKAIRDARLTGSMATHPTAIRDAMANIMDFDTVLGKFAFDPVGDAIYEPKILIVKNGQFEVFK